MNLRLPLTVQGAAAPLLGILLLLVAATSALAAPQSYALYLDTTGSMEGFGKSKIWTPLLNEIEAGAKRRRTFGGHPYPPKGPLAGEALNQQETDISAALQDWLENSGPEDALVLITDNVADDRIPGSAAAQQRFYDLLTARSRVTQISLVPAVLPFSGFVYEPGNDRNRAHYPADRRQFADRAVAIYLLVREARSDRAMAALEAWITGLLSRHSVSHDLLRILPFGIAGWQTGVRTDVTLARDSAQGMRASMDPNRKLLSIPNFPLGKPLRLSFEAEVQPGPNFRLKDAALDAVVRLEDEEFLASNQLVKARVTPRQADLEPERRQRFDVEFDIEPIDFFRHVSMPTKMKLAFSTSTVVRGEIAIQFTVRREQVFLAGGTARRWSFDGRPEDLAKSAPEVQAKLYRLQDLVRGMLPNEDLSREVLVLPLELELRYPAGPVLALGMAGLVMLAPLIWLLRRFMQPRHYRALDYGDGQGQTITPRFWSPSAATSADGNCLIRVRWVGIGLLVGSSARLLSGRFLGLGGGMVRVEGQDDGHRTLHTFRISPLDSKASRPGSMDDDW